MHFRDSEAGIAQLPFDAFLRHRAGDRRSAALARADCHRQPEALGPHGKQTDDEEAASYRPNTTRQ